MNARALALGLAALLALPGVAVASPAPQSPTPARGAIIALANTPHLWIADEAGVLHWGGDTRGLAGKFIDWNNRTTVTCEQLRGYRRGDPWLSAGLLKDGDPIYQVKWETSEAMPRLLQVASIGDVELFGIGAANYGTYVLDSAPWRTRWSVEPATLRREPLAAACPGTSTSAPPASAPPASAPAASQPVTALFVPVSALGPDYFEVSSGTTTPGLYFLDADSPSFVKISQIIYEGATAEHGSALLAAQVARYADPSSNSTAGWGPWLEVPSPGPPGSRAYRRTPAEGATTFTQLTVFTVKGRYYVNVVLSYHPDDEGWLSFTPERAGEVLTQLLARVPLEMGAGARI